MGLTKGEDFMCTALRLTFKELYFGRTLDIDRSFGEEICIYQRQRPLLLRHGEIIREHNAFIGMAAVISGEALYYDGVNEYGLCAAGLNFPQNAFYMMPEGGHSTVLTPFEIIPAVLGCCKSAAEAKRLLSGAVIADTPFSSNVPNSPLHFMIADRESSFILEPMRDGVHIYEDEVGVLTNNPPYPYQLEHLRKYKHLRTDNSKVIKNVDLPYSEYSQGLGGVGLPGDLSSSSRFIRMAFGRANSAIPEGENAAVGQFFHLLSTVEMVKGLCLTDENTLDHTLYTSCMNAERCIYYYTTYENRRISSVHMHEHPLNGDKFLRFPLNKKEDIFVQT